MRNLMHKAEAILCAQAAEAACVILHASISYESGPLLDCIYFPPAEDEKKDTIITIAAAVHEECMAVFFCKKQGIQLTDK